MLTDRYGEVDERIERLEGELEAAKKNGIFEREMAKTESSNRLRGQYDTLNQLQVCPNFSKKS